MTCTHQRSTSDQPQCKDESMLTTVTVPQSDALSCAFKCQHAATDTAAICATAAGRDAFTIQSPEACQAPHHQGLIALLSTDGVMQQAQLCDVRCVPVQPAACKVIRGICRPATSTPPDLGHKMLWLGGHSQHDTVLQRQALNWLDTVDMHFLLVNTCGRQGHSMRCHE